MKNLNLEENRFPWLKMTKPLKPFYPFDPRPEDIDITNIAWGLSMQCRFNGHVSEFYSVAQHSVIVSRIVESEHPFDNKLILQALLHDAHEAYIGDIVSPIKNLLPVFLEIEEKLDAVIMKKFGLDTTIAEPVREADMVALVSEARDLHPVPFLDERLNGVAPLDFTITPASQGEAYEMFLKRFEDLQDRLRFAEWQKSKQPIVEVA